MKLREIFFDSLAKLPARERAAVLIPAFEHARDDECSALAEHLVRTGRPEALRAVIRDWTRIESERRRSIARMASNPQPDIRSIIGAKQAQFLRNTVDFIRDRADALLAPSLVELLQFADPELHRQAAAALLRLTIDLLGPCGTRSADSRLIAAHDDAIASAVDSYRLHRCDDVLLAAAIVSARPGPRLQAILTQSDHPGTIALRSVPRHIDVDLVRMNLIRWLGVPIMHRPTLRRLDSIRTAGQWNDVLAAGHLLASPVRRRVIRRHPRPMRLLPNLADAVRLDGSAQSNLIDWVRACGLNAPKRMEYLADLIALPSPLARVKAVRSLAELSGAGVDGGTEALAPFARDGNSSVARYARRAWQHVAETHEIASESAGALAKQSHELDQYARLHTAFRLAARDPDRVADVLRVMLGSNRRDRAMAAMTLIERLGFYERMKLEMIAALDSDDAHVAASAVRVLGRAVLRDGNPELINCLRWMLDHDNARVRANAVEAIAAAQRVVSSEVVAGVTGVARGAELSSFTEAESNRLRANAIRAMLLDASMSSDAISMWKAMARDDRPLHRISAIWVACRTPTGLMLDELQLLSSPYEEPLPEVRTRAEAAAKWIARTGRVQSAELCAT